MFSHPLHGGPPSPPATHDQLGLGGSYLGPPHSALPTLPTFQQPQPQPGPSRPGPVPAQKRQREDEHPTASSSGSTVQKGSASGGGSGEGPKSDKVSSDWARTSSVWPAEGLTFSMSYFQSCKQCRQRKTKCTREWPKCGRCLERNLPCDFGVLVPVEFVNDIIADNRLASLESRLRKLKLLFRQRLSGVEPGADRLGWLGLLCETRFARVEPQSTTPTSTRVGSSRSRFHRLSRPDSRCFSDGFA